jgi:hypothetical protein
MGVVIALDARLRFGVVGTSGTLNTGSSGVLSVVDDFLAFVEVDFKVAVDFDFLSPLVFGSVGSAARFFETVLAGAAPFRSELGRDTLADRRRDILRTTF